MAIEEFDGIPVDTSLVTLDEWDGCCWMYPDGKCVAVNYAGHHRYARQLVGDSPLYDDMLADHHLMHVGESIYTGQGKRPTKAQRDNLTILAAHFNKVDYGIKKQDFKVHSYTGQDEWPI